MESVLPELIGAIVAALLPFLILWVRRVRARRIVVRSIERPDDRDLLPALNILERLPDTERDPPQTILRWTAEVHSDLAAGRSRLIDVILVAKLRNKPVGILYAHYYFKAKYLFISFLCIDKRSKEALRLRVTETLLRYLSRRLTKRPLRECKGIIFELDDPARAVGRENRRRRARLDTFYKLCAHSRRFLYPALVVNIDYRQPRLDVWDGSFTEVPLLLMYVPLRKLANPLTLTKAEATRILAFVYKDIYWDHFEDDPEHNAAFREYLNRLCDTVVSGLPPTIRLSATPVGRVQS